MSIVDEDLITLKQAEDIPISNGVMLSRRQIHHLCVQGKLAAQKVGTVWLVSRKSIEAYKPEETGFAVVWKKRRAQKAKLAAECAAILEEAKGAVEKLPTERVEVSDWGNVETPIAAKRAAILEQSKEEI